MLELDGTFIFALISFLIFLFIIKKILFMPITKVIDERENFYSKNSKMATDSKSKSQTLLAEKERLLTESRLEASELVKSETNSAKIEASKKISETKDEIRNKIELKTTELNNEKNNVKQEIKSEVSGFVSTIVSKVLGENIQVEIDENKINEYLNR